MRALAAAGLLLSSGCLLELDKTVSCGDGYIHRPAGEECEPSIESSFHNACREELRINQDGSCTEECKIDLSACFPDCGNGRLDGNEECDPGSSEPETGGLTGDEPQIGAELSCTQFDPPGGGDPYAGGILEVCQAGCTWDRSPCHHCGDGQVQESEICDGDLVDHARIDQLCLSRCVPLHQEPRPERVRCSARCSDSCDGYVVDDADPECCIPSGQPANPNIPCCEYEQEDGVCPFGLGE